MEEQFLAAQKVLKTLEEAGFEAFLVGGCVRDRLLGLRPADYDITTNALPSEVRQIFPRTIPTGLQHGTITVIQDNVVLEVTTYRTEGQYIDHRRPSDVQFVPELKEDLLRRDFTINAMAMDSAGKIIDYVDGQLDLVNKTIRTVGKAESRFKEDALRMLRACRFAAQLAFQIDSVTLEAISVCRDYAHYLAVERVVSEFAKLWATKKPSIGLKPLIQTGLISSLPPFHRNLASLHFTEDQWTKLDSLPGSSARWAYFFNLIFRKQENDKLVCNENIISLLSTFKFSNQQKRKIANLFRISEIWNPAMSEEEGKAMLIDFHYDTVFLGEKLWQLITDQQISVPLKKWWNQMPIHQFSELAINGNHLIEYTGKSAGPWLKETLHYLFHQVAFGRISNEREVLQKEGEKYGTRLTS